MISQGKIVDHHIRASAYHSACPLSLLWLLHVLLKGIINQANIWLLAGEQSSVMERSVFLTANVDIWPGHDVHSLSAHWVNFTRFLDKKHELWGRRLSRWEIASVSAMLTCQVWYLPNYSIKMTFFRKEIVLVARTVCDGIGCQWTVGELSLSLITQFCSLCFQTRARCMAWPAICCDYRRERQKQDYASEIYSLRGRGSANGPSEKVLNGKIGLSVTMCARLTDRVSTCKWNNRISFFLSVNFLTGGFFY
jgi:hypothetical protein